MLIMRLTYAVPQLLSKHESPWLLHTNKTILKSKLKCKIDWIPSITHLHVHRVRITPIHSVTINNTLNGWCFLHINLQFRISSLNEKFRYIQNSALLSISIGLTSLFSPPSQHHYSETAEIRLIDTCVKRSKR